MPAVEPVSKAAGDATERLAVLLKQWRLKPRRSGHRLRDLWRAFEEREATACARYERVATLGVETARLLDLSPTSEATIRASAFLSALARIASDLPPDRSKRTAASQGWEKELRGWRWVQVCSAVLSDLPLECEGSQPLSPHGEPAPIETRILALAEDFEDLTSGGGGGGALRALKVLSSKSGGRHDPELVELLLSEAGQATCDKVLRRGAYPRDRALTELEESVLLLERGPPGAPRQAPREPTPALREEVSDSSEPAAPPKVAAWPKEDHDRRDTMSKTTAGEQGSATSGGSRDAGGVSSLAARVTAAQSELKEIRAAADRGLEALASIAPAVEELSALVSRLQTSLLLGQGGENLSQAGPEPNGQRSIALRVERPQGRLNVGDVTDALDSVRDLRDVRVRDQGSSWAVLQARTDRETDLGILQAKVAGSLTRQLGSAEDGDAVEVSLLQDE